MTEPTDRFLVTGASGCIGSWTVRRLLDEATPVVGFDLAPGPGRLALLLDDDELASLPRVQADITSLADLRQAVEDHGITRIVHCAGLQVPFVRANPALGAQVNVTGTVNVFEAVRASAGAVRGLAYASSGAVFGTADAYPDAAVADDSDPLPLSTLYGVFKLANEWTARNYAHEHGVGSVGLRPFIVYGVGRDQGMTSSPSVAMLAAAAGQGYHLSYSGSGVFQYAPDVASYFIASARVEGTEAITTNVDGHTATVDEVVEAITAAAPELAGQFTCDDFVVPAPYRVVAPRHEVTADALTPLRDGVAATIEQFRRLLAEGRIQPPAPVATAATT